MAYLAPIHRPSSVRHAIKLNLLDEEEECLVLAKANRLEIWRLSSEGGLAMIHTKAIYGRVSMLQKIRPFGSSTDHLFVGTQRFQYFTVAWSPKKRGFETVQSFVDVSEKYMRDAQGRDRCLVDPSGQHLVLELFQGVLNLIKVIKPRKGRGEYLDRPEQVRISELVVRASTFLHVETNRPKIAFLYEDGKHGEVRLATYRIVDDKGQYSAFDHTKDRENDLGDLCYGALHLIPVPKGQNEQKRYVVRNAVGARAQVGGVVVVGETKMTYFDDEVMAVVECALDEASIFVAWERYDDLHYLLADDYGRLFLLSLLVDGASVTGLDVKKVGKTNKATALVYMGDGTLFVASHEGDSQVIRLDLRSDNPSIQTVQTFPNVAPILDFAVMDMGGREGETQTNEYSSGQARLVTGSGSFESGSLRSVRSGVGLEDIGILADMDDIRGVFALKSTEESLANDTLVVSFPIETRIFHFSSEGEVEEVEAFRGLSLNQHTLLSMSLSKGLLLQVTPTSAQILDRNPPYASAQWAPPSGQTITAASANDKQLLLSVNGITLVSLDIPGLKEIAVQQLGTEDQVACVHVSAQVPDIGIVGFWKSGSVSILNLSNLEILHSEGLRRTNSASIPRDIALTQVLPSEQFGPTLFIAMEDGIVLTFNVDKLDFSLSSRKSIVLGTQQARFEILPRSDNLFNVFATCEHPSLIYGSEGRIVYSAVTAEDATCVCSFNSEAFPGSIILATSTNIRISQIDTERRTHVRTLPMGRTIRRIAYSAKERAFGIGCIERSLFKGEEIISSSFALVEDVLFGEIGKPFILEDSNGPELIECVTRAELPTAHGERKPAERFIVGTSYLDETMLHQNERGRILIFGINSERTPYLIASHITIGACRQIAILDGKIVAALIKTVVIYNYNEETEATASLTKLATYRTSTCPIDLAVTGNTIAVADLLKSISLVEHQPGQTGLPDKLVEIARHHETCWSTAVTHIEENTYLESDTEGNLLILNQNPDGVTLEDRKRMDVTCEINLGEMVNKIQKINVDASPKAIAVPKAFLATTEGSIYLISLISPSSQNILMSLQTRMSGLIATLGDLPFDTYRAFKNQERETAEPFRFVDGELIERFLDVGEDVQEEICKGLGPSVEDVRSLVEELKRLH